MYPRYGLLGLRPAVSSATPSWVSPEYHPLQDSKFIDKGHPRAAANQMSSLLFCVSLIFIRREAAYR